MTLQFIENWFNNLPPKERDLPLVTLNGNAYTPRMVLNQVRDGTKLEKNYSKRSNQASSQKTRWR